MYSDLIIQCFVLLVAGVSAGFLAGLFGVGGGIVIVPALYALFNWMGLTSNGAISLAVGTSLVTLLPTALSSFRAHYRLGNVDAPLLSRLAPAVLLGALCASSFVVAQRGQLLLSVFACLLLFVSVTTFVRTLGVGPRLVLPEAATKEEQSRIDLGWVRWCYASLAGLFIGASSVLAGVGGGALGVPALLLLGLTAHRSVGTASCFGLLVSIPAIISLVLFSESPVSAPWGTWKQIYVPGLLVLGLCTVLIAPLGAKVGARMSARRLKLLFAFVLFFMGVRLLYSAIVFTV